MKYKSNQMDYIAISIDYFHHRWTYVTKKAKMNIIPTILLNMWVEIQFKILLLKHKNWTIEILLIAKIPEYHYKSLDQEWNKRQVLWINLDTMWMIFLQKI